MGLDMYLSAKRYLWSHEKNDQVLSEEIDKILEESDYIKEGALGRTKWITREAFYWRKAYAIHQWFVENVQGGYDNCQEYYVDREKLKELLETLKESLTDHDILPCQDDDTKWHFDHIKATISALEKLLSENLDQWDFYYQSSW